MSEEIKLIIQYVVYPLVTALVGLALFIFNFNIASLKKAIKELKEQHQKEIDHVEKKISKLFDRDDELERKQSETKSRIDVQVERCRIMHKWNGEERRL